MKRIVFTVPFLSKQMDGYDIRNNCFVRGRFTLLVALGNVGDIKGVGRLRWLPWLIWAWNPPKDGGECIPLREA